MLYINKQVSCPFCGTAKCPDISVEKEGTSDPILVKCWEWEGGCGKNFFVIPHITVHLVTAEYNEK